MREIVIRSGEVAIRARLLDTLTADQIWRALPIYADARTWGQEIYFAVAIASPPESGARDVVRRGEIAYWPQGAAIAIGFGPTPVSQKGEIRLASPCNVWAIALDDVTQLKAIYTGDRIAVLAADS